MAASPRALFTLSTLPGYSPLAPEERLTAARNAGAARLPTPKSTAKAAPPPADSDTGEDASWVKTDEDIVDYFEGHGAAAALEVDSRFFFCLPTAPPADQTADAREHAAAAEFFLRVVPPEAITHAPLHFIVSSRQIVRVQRSGAGETNFTEALPLAQWLAHKHAYLSLRNLTFFQCFSLAKCWATWRANVRGHVLRRRMTQLGGVLMPACDAFGQALLAAQATLEGQVRAIRGAAVQPGRRYTAAEWAEQQAAWRQRRAQPDLEVAAAALARTAEAAVQRVEASASEFERTVLPAELTDRIGVDLYAATSKARARSMQQIKADKLARAASYHKALAERTQLPRFLRLLDVQLRAALAHMVAASVADATAALHAAAPPSLLAGGSCDAVAAEDEEGPPSGRSATGGGTAPGTGGILMCSVVFAPDGSVAFSPSEEEWTAAMEAEVVASSLHLAGSMVPLLSLPAFEGYAAAAGLTGEAVPTAAELAQQDSVFTAAAGELRALVAGSFAAARQQAVRYAEYADIQRFEADFDFEAWAERQRTELDLAEAEATLHRLRSWQQQLESMPLASSAGLLRLDASGLHDSLAPVVANARERIAALLLSLAGERCRAVLQELSFWREVAAGRPPELDGFLPWRAQLEALQEELGSRLAAAAEVDAALEVVLCFAGRLPTAVAVKRDDLREAAAALPGELEEAAAWELAQRGEHAGAVADQAGTLVEEAVMLEAELQVGQYVDPGAPLDEVLADLELAGARTAQLEAQAGELAALLEELGGESLPFQEVQEAGAALRRCVDLWQAVSDAELLQSRVAGGGEREQEEHLGEGALQEAVAAAAALQERLAELRGSGPAPDAVWLRASTALQASLSALGNS